MKLLVLVLLILSAYYGLSPFFPSPKGSFIRPFTADARPWFLPSHQTPSSLLASMTILLANIAGGGFGFSVLGLFFSGPAPAWPVMVLIAASASALLFLIYFSRWAVIPLLLDAALFIGILAGHWTVAFFNG